MGTIWMPGGGGGADTSIVTATAEDVLAPKVIVGPDGEPIDGTMVNNGAVSHSLPINGTYPIPKGYHDGNGKVSQSIPVQGGSNNIPTTAQKLIVAAGRYVNQNIYIAGDPNFTEANIKKGVTIWGKTGTHSGYVPSATDLYLRGNNKSGWQVYNNTASFDTGQITLEEAHLGIFATVNFAGYTRLNFEFYKSRVTSYPSYVKLFTERTVVDGKEIAEVSVNNIVGNQTVGLNISALQQSRIWYVYFLHFGIGSAIYRIWLS